MRPRAAPGSQPVRFPGRTAEYVHGHECHATDQDGQPDWRLFASQPDAEQARMDFALHLKRQWDPQMRTALFAHLDATAGEGLNPFVLSALSGLRDQIEPQVHA